MKAFKADFCRMADVRFFFFLLFLLYIFRRCSTCS